MPASSSPATDELDRLFQHLVRNLAALDPSRVHGPVEVAELVQRLVPYRTHRAELAVDTHADYEMTVLRLLAGERGYAFVEPEDARSAFVQEVGAVNPDTALYRRFPAATLTLDPEAVREALGRPVAPAGDAGLTTGAAAEEPPADIFEPLAPLTAAAIEGGPEARADEAPAGERSAGEDLPFALDDEEQPLAVSPRTASAPCAYCGGELPVGRAVIFCPHCGQNVGVVHCPTCGTELDVGWRFCITCGRQMMALG